MKPTQMWATVAPLASHSCIPPDVSYLCLTKTTQNMNAFHDLILFSLFSILKKGMLEYVAYLEKVWPVSGRSRSKHPDPVMWVLQVFDISDT